MNDDYPHPLGHEQERERARARDPILFPAPDLGRCTRAAIGNDRSSQDRNNHSDSDSDSDSDSEEEEEHLVILEGSKEALWLRENLRDTKYGYLWEADVLRRSQQQTTSDEVIWNVTGEKCAVKRSSWEKIRKAKCTEKPEKEVAAMQYIKSRIENWRNEDNIPMEPPMDESLKTNVAVLRNALTDDTFLYTVTPFFEGGGLLDGLINECTRFNEAEARYCMDHILNGIETLQRAGICHRNLSIENLMIHSGHITIIDMGTCLGIPYEEEEGQQHRRLIRGQGPCGKWKFMSPEIRCSITPPITPFDGHAVDMWGVGTILFTMLVGFDVENGNESEERFVEWAFHNISRGKIHKVLNYLNKEKKIDITFSPELKSLMLEMFWEYPKQRLSLKQVRSHPWMKIGERQTPHVAPRYSGIPQVVTVVSNSRHTHG